MNRILLISGVLLFLLGFGASALDSEEAQFLSLINDYRTQSSECYDQNAGWMPWPTGSVRTLTEAPSLSTAADGHNVTMINGGCFSHQCPGELAFDERANNAGYTGWSYLSENIAYGTTLDAAGAMNLWQNSQGHNQNMLGCRAVAIGIARELGNDLDGWRWTTMFGDVIQAGGAPAPAPPPANDPPPPVNDPPPPPQQQPPANSGSGAQRYDTDGDCTISQAEFFVALDDWLGGQIDDFLFFSIVDLWLSGGNACASAADAVMFSALMNASSTQMTFRALSTDVVSTSVEVYSLTGKRVYAGKSRGSELHWNMRTRTGKAVANGIYLYRIIARTAAGAVISNDMQKLVVLR